MDFENTKYKEYTVPNPIKSRTHRKLVHKGQSVQTANILKNKTAKFWMKFTVPNKCVLFFYTKKLGKQKYETI